MTYLRLFSTKFDEMLDAMTMALNVLSPFSCRSIFSTGMTPLSSQMGSGWPSTLQSTHEAMSPLADIRAAQCRHLLEARQG
eukprot:scaffold3542_cov113-Isochrysis_galbana.AAC.2